jgi:hypothetical protein
MEVEYVDGSTLDLISDLEKDLEKVDKIKALARMPEPSKARRYREVLFNIYRETGFIYAIVAIEFKDDVKKIYVFSGRSIVSKDAKDYIETPVYTEGYLIIRESGSSRHVIYNPYTFKDARVLFRRISELGDKYRLSDYEVYMERIMEYIDFDTVL